jgi:hypothetical protein
MKTLIGAAVVAGGLALAGLASIQPAAAASPKAGVHAIDGSQATDLSARRRYRYGYRRYQPYYLARPTYYRPYPYPFASSTTACAPALRSFEISRYSGESTQAR